MAETATFPELLATYLRRPRVRGAVVHDARVAAICAAHSVQTLLTCAVGNTVSAGFASGTTITLTVSGGREAVWSGACSSGGNERRSCTLTISGNGSVTADVD